jgi:fatty acid desaturase
MSAPASLIYECAGAPGLQPLGRNDLSPALRAEIRRLQRPEPRRSLGRLGVFLVLWAAAAVAPLLLPVFAVKCASIIVAAGALVGLSVLMHEASHHLLFRSRWLNRFVGVCCATPVLISFSAYRSLHLRHHAFEHTADDPDDIETVSRKGLPLVLVYYVLLLIGTYIYFPHVAVEGWRASHGRSERGRIVAEYALMAAMVALCWHLAPEAIIRVWLLPMAVAAQLSNLRSLAEHGLTTGGSPFTASRSVRSNRVVSFFFCNLNFHLEHHLFPAVPWHNLPQLHQLLQPAYRVAGSSVYNSYTEFLRDFVRTSATGLVPNVRLLPDHLREDICA